MMNHSGHKPASDSKHIDELLNELAKVASSDDALLDKLRDVELSIRRVIGVRSCSVWIVERNEAWADRGTGGFRVRPDTGPLGKFITSDEEFLFTDDYLHDARIDQFSPEAQNFRITLSRSKGYVPGDTVPQAYVRIRPKDATLGVMLISLRSGKRWTEDDKWWLRHVAGIVAHIIESDKLLKRIRQSEKQERIHELLLLLLPIASSSIPFRDKMVQIEKVFSDLLPVSNARIWIRKGDEAFPAANPDGFKLDRNSGSLGRFLLGDEDFFWTNDYFNDPRIDPSSREAAHYKVSSAKLYGPDQPVPQAYVKIRSGDNTLGAIVCAAMPNSEFSANDEWWLTHVAAMLALVIENQRLAQESAKSRAKPQHETDLPRERK